MVRGRQKHRLPRRSLARGAEAVLRAWSWPGNVRELERTLYRALSTGTGRSLQAKDLQRILGTEVADEGGAEPSLVEVLERMGPTKAGDLRANLGMSKSTFGRKVAPLVEEGVVVREGSGGGTRYRLAAHRPVEAAQDPRWTTALELAQLEGRLSRGLLATRLGVSKRTALRVLAAMVQAGLMVEDGGRGRNAGYRLP